MKTEKLKPREQTKRFEEAARALGCDENEAAFDEKLKGIAKHTPKTEKAVNDGKRSS